MSIPSLPSSNYGTHANAVLTFVVSGFATVDDPETGNPVPRPETLTYSAALRIAGPDWKGQPGIDMTDYNCSGRLLDPPTLDPRLTSGTQAEATINGYSGTFELRPDIGINRVALPAIRQAIQGKFTIVGGSP